MDLAQKLEKLAWVEYTGQMSINAFERSFPYKFKINVNESNCVNYTNGWETYADIAKEIRRQGIDLQTSEQFKMIDNSYFDICATYPSKFVVPKAMSREQIIACSKFRTKQRLPALSYYYKYNACSIWRCSQCMSGMFNARVVEDEKMVEDIAKTAMSSKSMSHMMHNSRIVIYDARPYLNAQANRLKKGGYEDVRNYRNSEILFCDIDNIHEVSKVFKKTQEMTL